MRAWAALRPASVESRFEALHASGLTELVGREEELELLLRRWSKAKSGEGQVVLLSGEAGHRQVAADRGADGTPRSASHTRACAISARRSTPTARFIRSSARWSAPPGSRTTTRRKRSSTNSMRCWRRASTPRQDAALFAEMLSLPNDGRYPALELAPQQRRQKTLEALDCASGGAVAVQAGADDLRGCALDRPDEPGSAWPDRGPDTERFRVLLIVTFRPEFEPPWIGRPHVTALTLNRLGEREIAAMIDRVTGNKPLPESIRQDIIERTDGIPLFVEEMTKAVLEAESEGDARKTAAAVPSPALAVPASLHASLMARLDRLGSGQGGGADRGGDRAGVLSCPAGCGGRASRRQSSNRRSTVSSRPVCCSGRACRRTRLICSSTRWCRTRPMARCCASRDARFTPASPKLLRANSPKLPRASRNCWRVTAPRPG